jgi:hypothetical protein
MRPLSENVWSLNGLPTLVRPAVSVVGLNSDERSAAISFWIAALRSGVSSRCPSGAASTMLSTLPCSDWNCDSIRSVARCVSEPGISNSSRSPPPTVATSPIRTTTIPSHPKITRHGWVAQIRAQPASVPVASLSWAARCPFVGGPAAPLSGVSVCALIVKPRLQSDVSG